MTVWRLLHGGLTRQKPTVFNANGAALMSAEAALEAGRAGQWECLANSRLIAPNDELEARAFWINLYNALTLHAMHEAQIASTVLERAGFFNGFAYQVSDLNFSLNDIEHGVLRGNRAALLSAPPFGANDPRVLFALPLDPRIHFALNCGAVSCPPIRVYEAAKLEGQLSAAAQSSLQSARLEGATVWLPRLLEYYKSDFGDPLEYARRYRDDLPIAARVRFDPYDWSRAS